MTAFLRRFFGQVPHIVRIVRCGRVRCNRGVCPLKFRHLHLQVVGQSNYQDALARRSLRSSP